MNFKIIPYKGALPLLFGMSPKEIQKVLNSKPLSQSSPDEYGKSREDYDFVGINYDKNNKAAEFCFSPVEGLILTLNNNILIGSEAIKNSVDVFRRLDSNPKEKLGFLIFEGIGINTTGYHDNDKSQRAINVFSKGFWDNI